MSADGAPRGGWGAGTPLAARLTTLLRGRSALWDAAVFLCVLVALNTVRATIELPMGSIGRDFTLYQRHVESILAGGPMYPPNELAGPFAVTDGAIMYPPIAILAFAPTLLLPGPLWWAIPLAILAVQLIRWRPRHLAVALIAACVAYRGTTELALAGNPTMWLSAALAVALERWPAAAAAILLKPSLLPFAFVGIRSRAWWLVAGAFALGSLLLLPATLDWVTVVLHSAGRTGPLYSLMDVPFMAIPLIAWWGRGRVGRDSAPAVVGATDSV